MMIGSGHPDEDDEHIISLLGPAPMVVAVAAGPSSSPSSPPPPPAPRRKGAAIRTSWAFLMIVSMLGFMWSTSVRNLGAVTKQQQEQQQQQDDENVSDQARRVEHKTNLKDLRFNLPELQGKDEEKLREQLESYLRHNVGDYGRMIESPAAADDQNRRAGGVNHDFSEAYGQSFGFFDDVPSSTWTLMKQRVRERSNHLDPEKPMDMSEDPKVWYQLNWEPDFSCPNERRVGGMGDGPKWVCNPHRIRDISGQRKEVTGNGCLVYSIGSHGNFVFESALRDIVGEDTCEIHVFDTEDYEGLLPPNVFYHQWAIKSAADETKPEDHKTLKEIVDILGHSGRVIDVFKLDCEGCEWDIYPEWFTSGVDIHQMMVETHYVPENANDLFDTIQNEGYVTFHKEPNTWSAEGACQEYAFIKMDNTFFED